MKSNQDYLSDLTEIRSIMERSTKFLSLSGRAGILAGIYALIGAWFSATRLGFSPDTIMYVFPSKENPEATVLDLIFLGSAILILAIGSALFYSINNAKKRRESVWNATSKRMVLATAVPLLSGGVLACTFLAQGLMGLILPTTLIFYGLALFSAGNYTFRDVQWFGIIEIVLGLISLWFISYSLIIWSIGFGVLHIIYGAFIHAKYERK